MPLARFEAEQLEGNRWVIEAEAGGFVGQRNFEHRTLRATSFEGMQAAMAEFYYRQVLRELPSVDSSVTPDVSGRDQPPPETPPEVTDEPKMADERPALRADLVARVDGDERDALRAEAVALGIGVDNRWAVKRLHTEIAKARKAAYVQGGAVHLDGDTVVG